MQNLRKRTSEKRLRGSVLHGPYPGCGATRVYRCCTKEEGDRAMRPPSFFNSAVLLVLGVALVAEVAGPRAERGCGPAIIRRRLLGDVQASVDRARGRRRIVCCNIARIRDRHELVLQV